MNRILKILAVVLGLGLLYMSVGWSRDGFKFDFTQPTMDANRVMIYGVTLALTATLLQFIFATAYKELNITLLVLGLFAYVYSIGTNIAGIMVMQGKTNAGLMTWVLGIIMDVAPEPMIAWGLGQALAGDFLGNLFKAIDGNNGKATYTKSKSKVTARNKANKTPSHTTRTESIHRQKHKEENTPPWR